MLARTFGDSLPQGAPHLTLSRPTASVRFWVSAFLEECGELEFLHPRFLQGARSVEIPEFLPAIGEGSESSLENPSQRRGAQRDGTVIPAT